MDCLHIAIEGYNKEKLEIQNKLLYKTNSADASKYDFFRERIAQIDRNIERLISYKYLK